MSNDTNNGLTENETKSLTALYASLDYMKCNDLDYDQVINSFLMKFEKTKLDMWKSTNATKTCYVENVASLGWVATYEDEKFLLDSDEEYFDTPSQAVKWLMERVPFSCEIA
jgi:hypothetical protein